MKEQKFLTEQTLNESRSGKLTAKESVELSLALQAMRDALEGSRDQLVQKKERCEELLVQRRGHYLWMIIGFIALMVLMWVNYVLDY